MPPNPSQNTPPARSAGHAVVDVVGAVIRDGGRVLMAQRPEGKVQAGLWEFPGGKIEPGETPEDALARECREELALEIGNPSVLRSVVHRYPEKTVRLLLVECSVRPGSVPVPQEGQSVAWVRPSDLDRLPVCPADKELLPFVFA
jgi:8-oxo-dGTP diphosphatase